MKAESYVFLIEIILGYLSILFSTVFTGLWFLSEKLFFAIMGFYCLLVGLLLVPGRLIERYLEWKQEKGWREKEV